MSDKVYNKNLLGMEDLVQTETAEQVRGDQVVTIKGILAANISCKDSKSILEYIEFLEDRVDTLEDQVDIIIGGL